MNWGKTIRSGSSRTFETGIPRQEIIERRRQALLVDVFFTGSNALTESGQLVNLDMVGNRVAAIVFGPRHVVITVGRNKIVPGSSGDAADQRLRRPSQRHPPCRLEYALHQDRPMQRLPQPRPDLQCLVDHRKIVPQGQDQGGAHQPGSRPVAAMADRIAAFTCRQVGEA